MKEAQSEVIPLSASALSWSTHVKELQKSNRQLLRHLPEFSGNQWVLYPDDWFMDLWGAVMSLLMVYTATILPYRVAFLGSESIEWRSWEYSLDVCFGLDVCINSVLAYYDEDMSLVVSRRRIFLHYLTTWMIPDIASCFPLELILSMQRYNNLIRLAKLPRVSKLIKLAKLLRMIKVVKNRRHIVRHANSVLRISLSIERLFWFIVWLLILLHLFACCWVFFAKLDEEDPENWILCKGYADFDDLQLYTVAIYFSITTLATVGYGDITACNTTEKVVCSVMMLVGIFVYSVTIGCLTTLLANLDKRKVILDKRIELLAELSKKYHFNTLFFHKLSQAVEYEQRNSQKELNDLFIGLPSTLRTKLLILIYCKMLEANAFFAERSEHFVAWVAQRLNPVRIVENEFVYREREPAAEMYFVIKGEVEYVLVRSGKKEAYHVVRENYYFGEEDLLLSGSKLHQFNTKTAAKSEFLVLSKGNFDEMLNTFDSETIEIYAMTEKRKQRILLHKDLAEQRIQANRLVTRHETAPAQRADIQSAVTEFVKNQGNGHCSEDSSDEDVEEGKTESQFSCALFSAELLLQEEQGSEMRVERKGSKTAKSMGKKKGKRRDEEFMEMHQKIDRIEAKFDELSEVVRRIAEQVGAYQQPFAQGSRLSEAYLDGAAEAGMEDEEEKLSK
jgi:CRP-like cAMP-binding protein